MGPNGPPFDFTVFDNQLSVASHTYPKLTPDPHCSGPYLDEIIQLQAMLEDMRTERIRQDGINSRLFSTGFRCLLPSFVDEIR